MSPAVPLTKIIWVGLGAWLWAILVTPVIRRLAVSLECVSRPTQDRWGRRVIPRLGGLSIATALLAVVTWSIPRDPRMIGLLSGGFLMLLTGLADDFRQLHPYTKLITQIIAGCFVVLSGVQFPVAISWLAIPVTIAWLVLVMNAFNLMDNMDGLSAGIGAIAAGFCAWHALQGDQRLIALCSISLAGSSLGFLRYNLSPAKIFMGDTGSQILGLGLGALALMGTGNQPTRLLGILALPTLLLAVPIFDTCFVAFQRVLHGRHPFQGGTDHLSHRLGILGLTTRQVAYTSYAFSAGFGALSVLLYQQGTIAVTGIWLLAVGLLLSIGTYLSKVRVYTGPSPDSAEPRVTVIETMLLHKWRIAEVLVDFMLIYASYVMAHALRFETNLTPDLEELIFKSIPWVIAVKMLCFHSCGLYRGIWRYISLPDLVNILRAVILGSVLSTLVLVYLWRFEGYSRAVFIIDGLLLFFSISGARLIEPLLNEWITSSIQDAKPVLIVGAGDTGGLLLQHLKFDRQRRQRVIGFLDDDAKKQGDRIHGIPIMGPRQELGRIVQEFGVRDVLIAMRRPPDDLVQQVRSYCEENGISWKVVQTVTPEETTTPSGA